MYTTYDREFAWPQRQYNYNLKSLYVPINPTKAYETLEQQEQALEKEPSENDEKDKVAELPMQLEWTSTLPFGHLLDRKLIPINVTNEEQRRIDELVESDDFNFLPCPHKKADKRMEAAVRSISAQTGIEYDELMKDVYEQRDQWHQTAIGQAEIYMRDAFERKRNDKLVAKETVF
ncbi:uncharacterized protein LOC120769406 [Bactrocera tryoni]|uniref:uncharacterized protein LOC120769406 n=1 Tax=Bactrocera tryoni TaxID=59916 RepID=UPI001A959345|nr:uncharacterized protein LOC120769406 [Bactrocera tryoni]